jgi:hypothetical protein
MPNPLAWPPREFSGSGRFDDPRNAFRVLYAATRRRGAFLETLAAFRPSLEALARLRRMESGLAPRAAAVPADWRRRRALGRFHLRPGQRWLDLRTPETHEALRQDLPSTLLDLGQEDLDLSGLVGPDRRLTQAIARWAYEAGFSGLAYTSRLDSRLVCWAIFEGAEFEVIGAPEPIELNDPDLVAIARLFNLAL